MSRDDKRRYIIVMVIGVALNFGLYEIAHAFHLPAWMDCIGTAYTAILLEPAAGLLVAFATNFYQAAVIYDSSSLIYYAVSAVTALAFGVGLRRKGELRMRRIFLSSLLFILINTAIGSLITLWRTAGVPDSGWERYFYQAALFRGVSHEAACFFGTFVLKVIDGVILTFVIPLLYALTPKKLINRRLKEVVSWEEPFFRKCRADGAGEENRRD